MPQVDHPFVFYTVSKLHFDAITVNDQFHETHHFVLDVASAVGVVQCRHSLVQRVSRGAHTRDEQRLAVSSKSILRQRLYGSYNKVDDLDVFSGRGSSGI